MGRLEYRVAWNAPKWKRTHYSRPGSLQYVTKRIKKRLEVTEVEGLAPTLHVREVGEWAELDRYKGGDKRPTNTINRQRSDLPFNTIKKDLKLSKGEAIPNVLVLAKRARITRRNAQAFREAAITNGYADYGERNKLVTTKGWRE